MEMKRFFLIALIIITCAGGVYANWFVSANGSDENTGSTADKPVRTLNRALHLAGNTIWKKITIIGTLDINSEGESRQPSVFTLSSSPFFLDGEIIITGNPEATGAEKAVLSGIGSNKGVLLITNLKIRLEHIEISGGEGDLGNGMFILNNSEVIIGPGVVVKSNKTAGIGIMGRSTCLIDGGDIRENGTVGVVAAENSNLTLRNGTIRGNLGGGLEIQANSHFTMSGGSVTGNRLGGVLALGRFDQTGGTISDNDGRNIIRPR